MNFARDELYDRPQDVVDFRFDERTAAVFPDMIHRSIPGYATLVQMLAVIAAQYADDDAHIYDLGCSLGAATLAMRRYLPASATITALDLSPAMIARLRDYVSGAGIANVRVEHGDLCDYVLSPCRVVVMNFVLQFIDPAARNTVIARVYRALQPGGVLLLAEKTTPEQTSAADLRGWHEAFKAAQGYSDMAIAQKREALENVMRTETAQAEVARLYEAGFRRVTPFYQAMMFRAWVAEK